jgi:putative drug exporter of the RND superfamily
VLLVLTLPLFGLRLGFPDEGTNQKSETSRQAYDLLTTGFGPGFNGPLLLVVDFERAASPRGALRAVTDAVSADPGIASVTAPQVNDGGDTAIITAFPTTKPEDEPPPIS